MFSARLFRHLAQLQPDNTAAGLRVVRYSDGQLPEFPTSSPPEPFDWERMSENESFDQIQASQALQYVVAGRAVIHPYKPSFGAELEDNISEWPLSKKAREVLAYPEWASKSPSERLLLTWMQVGADRMYRKEMRDFSETFYPRLAKSDYEEPEDGLHAPGDTEIMNLAMVPVKYGDILRVSQYDGYETPYLNCMLYMKNLIRDRLEECGTWSALEQDAVEREMKSMMFWTIAEPRKYFTHQSTEPKPWPEDEEEAERGASREARSTFPLHELLIRF